MEYKLTPEIITLHRYFIWADRMRVHFDEVLSNNKNTTTIETEEFIEKKKGIDTFLYMSLWYGTFYVLIEGWIELGLSDPEIDTFLKSPNVNLLRRYRNGAFHFQKDYFDKHFTELMTEGEDFANWSRDLRDHISRWFLDIHRQSKEEQGLEPSST
ncbi:MAG: hypothetical protein AAB443_02135 [Patescibacteria group bacterium]